MSKLWGTTALFHKQTQALAQAPQSEVAARASNCQYIQMRFKLLFSPVGVHLHDHMLISSWRNGRRVVSHIILNWRQGARIVANATDFAVFGGTEPILDATRARCSAFSNPTRTAQIAPLAGVSSKVAMALRAIRSLVKIEAHVASLPPGSVGQFWCSRLPCARWNPSAWRLS